MRSQYRSFLASLSDTPLLISGDRADWMASCLRVAATMNLTAIADAIQKMDDEFWPKKGDYMERYRPYRVTDGVLSIPVTGMLLHGVPYTISGYLTGYPYIQAAFARGFADPEVRGIALDINSGGGESRGMFDLLDAVKAMKGEKPVKAILNEEAYSAAYAIATLGKTISAPRTGGAGSVGVYRMHVDYSQMLKKSGIKVTFIKAGKYKTDGNPYEPLTASAKDSFQERVDFVYSLFTEAVADRRPMSVEEVIATQARCYGADAAKENGLIDVVASAVVSMKQFTEKLSPQGKGFSMTTSTDKAAASTFTQTDIDAATNAGVETGRREERSRITAILGSEHAAGRMSTALELAMSTGVSAAEAEKVLAKTPRGADAVPSEEKKAAEKSAFERMMDNFQNPNVGVSGQGGDEDKTTAQPGVNRFAAAYALAGGQVKKAS